MLAYFKYTNFLIDIANQTVRAGIHSQFQNIFLPVGISFFVFQSMSYTIRHLPRSAQAARQLVRLPVLPLVLPAAGGRARSSAQGTSSRKSGRTRIVVTREMFGTGVFLILTGLFKKAIISDYISLNFVDRIFDEPLLYSGFEMSGGHLRLRPANLLRLLRLFGHGHRHRPAAGLPLPQELRRPLQVGHHHRILAAVAHLALHMAARLPLHFAGRQPQRQTAHLRQPAHHDAAGRTVARRRRPLHPLGRAARRGAGAAQALDGGRAGRQGHGRPDALVEPRGRHLLHVQPRLSAGG